MRDEDVDIDIDIKIDLDEDEHRHHKHRLNRWDISVGPALLVAIEESDHMADLSVTLTDTQQTTVRSSGGSDAAGQPIAGVTFAYSAASGGVVTVSDNGDGTASVIAAGIGTDSSTVTGTAPDGSTASSALSWTVVTGPLAAFDTTADAPSEVAAQPAPVPPVDVPVDGGDAPAA